ncbi:MAG: hypothetical protein ACFFBH_15315 [Promethearchaeota archaeon]
MGSNSYRRKKIVKLVFKILLLVVGILFDVLTILSLAGKLGRLFFIIGLFYGPFCTFFGIFLLLPKKLSVFSVMIIIGSIILIFMMYLALIISLIFPVKGAYA